MNSTNPTPSPALYDSQNNSPPRFLLTFKRVCCYTDRTCGIVRQQMGNAMHANYILALDQGTTSSRALLFDADGTPVASQQQEFPQYFPNPGWVEHNPDEIWQSQRDVALLLLHRVGITASELAGIGITNQRETTIVWERATGRPLHNAIVWQCRRTAPACDRLKRNGVAEMIQQRTGLVIDAYFSATKIAWILDAIDPHRTRARRGELCFGTVDSWLLWNLTSGRVHATDITNASRTMLLNLATGDWDTELLQLFNIPHEMLPTIYPSGADFGDADLHNARIPIRAVIGDQQAALFGQNCLTPGMAKNTYGTGCFLLLHTGNQPRLSENKLLTTPAWRIGNQTEYAMEGSVFMGGATIQWLRDELGLISSAQASEAAADAVPDTAGVHLVPAFTGLGAPYWNSDARGCITGLTRGATRNHIIRAALESIAFQSRDLLDAMQRDTDTPLKALRVDGGASRNDFLMQFQANILGTPVQRPRITETTALGAALLCGLTAGLWKSREELSHTWQLDREFLPQISADQRQSLYLGWQHAVRQCTAT